MQMPIHCSTLQLCSSAECLQRSCATLGVGRTHTGREGGGRFPHTTAWPDKYLLLQFNDAKLMCLCY